MGSGWVWGPFHPNAAQARLWTWLPTFTSYGMGTQ